MSVRYAAKSDVGQVREANEDSYLVQEPLFVVADGMGGHAAGDVASQMAVETLMKDIDTSSNVSRDSLVNAVRHANEVIFKESQGNAERSGMGTTCTLIFVRGGEARIAHVGDSRAYLLRAGSLSQITDDHTLVNRMVKEGRLRPEDAERHPQRSIITRALGVDSNVKVDYKTLELQEGDRLLICSDGLSSMLDSAAIERALIEYSEPDAATDRLIELANEAGGEDNITVVLIDVTEWDEVSPAPQAATSAPSSPVVREPIRTDPEAAPSTPRASLVVGPRRRWPRRLLIWFVALAVVGAGGYFAANYFLDRSWFVGLNEDGYVTIYQGIPEEVLGMDLKDEVRATAITLEDLPDFLHEGVTEGIKVESEEDARTRVENLRQRAREVERTNNNGSGDGQNSTGGDGTKDG